MLNRFYVLEMVTRTRPLPASLSCAGLTSASLLPQLRNLAERGMASVKDMTAAEPPRPTLEELRMTLPSVGGWSPQCRNMAGPAEDTLSTLKCSACAVAQYCSAACQKAHWKAHQTACRART